MENGIASQKFGLWETYENDCPKFFANRDGGFYESAIMKLTPNTNKLLNKMMHVSITLMG